MDEQDERLDQIIAAVRQHPEPSLEWRKAMDQLLSYIPRLPGLARCSHLDYPEVLNDTLALVGKKIQEFRPVSDSLSNSLVVWINYKLRHKYRVLELYQHSPDSPISIDNQACIEAGSRETFAEKLPDPRPSTIWELEDEIERWQQQQKIESIGSKLRRYIEQDPEGKLRRCVSRKYPDCNCHLLSQRLYLRNPPDNLATFASQFNIPYQTVVSHWKKKGLPLLQAIAIEIGYSPNQHL